MANLALRTTDDKVAWVLGALMDVGIWPWAAAALLLYVKTGVSSDNDGGGDGGDR